MAARTQPDPFISSALADGPVIHSLDGAAEPPQPLLVLDFPSKFWSLVLSPLITGLFGAAVAFVISYAAIHTVVGKLQDRLDAVTAELHAKADSQRMQELATDLKGDMTQVRTAVAPLSAAIGDHGARVGHDEADIAGLKSELAAHARSAAQNEVKIAYLEKQLAELDRLRNEVSNLKLRLVGR